MDKVEVLLIKNLLYNEEYGRKVIPFIKSEYFEDLNYKILFEEISSFIIKYDELPTQESLLIDIENRIDLNESSYKDISQIISYLEKEPSDFEWLMDTTEKWCRDSCYIFGTDGIYCASRWKG